MGEFTPSTKYVKAAYDSFMIEFKDDYTGDKQFDRWLAQRDAEVAKAERQRITSFILDNTYDSAINGTLCWVWDVTYVTQSELIQFIKRDRL